MVIGWSLAARFSPKVLGVIFRNQIVPSVPRSGLVELPTLYKPFKKSVRFCLARCDFCFWEDMVGTGSCGMVIWGTYMVFIPAHSQNHRMVNARQCHDQGFQRLSATRTAFYIFTAVFTAVTYRMSTYVST